MRSRRGGSRDRGARRRSVMIHRSLSVRRSARFALAVFVHTDVEA